MNTIPRRSLLRSQRGIVLPLVAVLLFVLLGFAAFAVDFGHLYVVRNQLQNAADAAALAGASVLYENPLIIDHAQVFETAAAVTNLNYSGGKSVPPPDIEIGHYAFPPQWDQPGTFTPTQTYVQMTGWQDVKFSDLNGNTNFINAVRATVSRNDVPRFFSGIFGSSLLESRTQAIAYLGFAGILNPGALDQPIGICSNAITDASGTLTCGLGRMLNSGQGNLSSETAGWTNFTQDPCSTTTGNDVNNLVCGDGNENTLYYGRDMGTTGGTKPFGRFYDCWKGNNELNISADGYPTEPWNMTLAVIECNKSNVEPCSKLLGAVEVSVVWVNDTLQGGGNYYNTAPKKMGNWANSDPNGEVRWNSFVEHFGLWDTLNNRPATFEQKNIYFLPSCEPREAVGKTGGENYGVLAKHPVLVK